MDNHSAIKHLTGIRAAKLAAFDRIDRKRWRPSEKAMAKAKLLSEADAIDIGIAALKGEIRVHREKYLD
jgi:hypothetical protein